MELFYLYRLEIFLISGLGFFLTTSLLILSEGLEKKKITKRFNRAAGKASVLNENLIETLTAKKKKSRARLKENQQKQKRSLLDSPRDFYEQFDSVPMQLLQNELAAKHEQEIEVDETSEFSEKILTPENKDALKIAIEMDEEVQSSKEGA